MIDVLSLRSLEICLRSRKKVKYLNMSYLNQMIRKKFKGSWGSFYNSTSIRNQNLIIGYFMNRYIFIFIELSYFYTVTLSISLVDLWIGDKILYMFNCLLGLTLNCGQELCMRGQKLYTYNKEINYRWGQSCLVRPSRFIVPNRAIQSL